MLTVHALKLNIFSESLTIHRSIMKRVTDGDRKRMLFYLYYYVCEGPLHFVRDRQRPLFDRAWEPNKETDRQTDRERDRQTEKGTDRQTDRERMLSYLYYYVCEGQLHFVGDRQRPQCEDS